MEAEETALDHARSVEDIHQALAFFMEWPDKERAAELVLNESEKWDGNRSLLTYRLFPNAART